eukprot:5470653-Ditylum_brightwellii.AAC.1
MKLLTTLSGWGSTLNAYVNIQNITVEDSLTSMEDLIFSKLDMLHHDENCQDFAEMIDDVEEFINVILANDNIHFNKIIDDTRFAVNNNVDYK